MHQVLSLVQLFKGLMSRAGKQPSGTTAPGQWEYKMLSRIKRIFSPPHIAVDLGTANTRVYAAGRGAFTEEPSLVRHTGGEDPKHLTNEYLVYLNRQTASMPIRGGVVVDIRNATNLLKPLLQRTGKGFRPPVSLACAPTDTSARERELLSKAILNAGAAHVAIIPEVWAAAIGAGLDITLPYAQVLIDIGEGVTDLAVIRDGRLVYAAAVRTACSDLQKAIRNAIIARHRVNPDHEELERLTHEIAALSPQARTDEGCLTVNGMDIIGRRRVSVVVERRHIVAAMKPVFANMLGMIETGLRRLPETASCEIAESGIWLTGGGARITGIDRLIEEKTGLAVQIPQDPLHSVINGAIETLNYWQGKGGWWKNIAWPKYDLINIGRC
jgi:rod shape-determining protein MreB